MRELGPLWRRDLEFSLTLLRQFLNDVQAFVGANPSEPDLSPLPFVEYSSCPPHSCVTPDFPSRLFSFVFKCLGYAPGAETPLLLSSWMKPEVQVGFNSVIVQFLTVSRSLHEARRESDLVLPSTISFFRFS